MDHLGSSAIATSGAVAAAVDVAVNLTWMYVAAAATGATKLAVALAMTWGDDADNHVRNDSPAETTAAGPTAAAAAETERMDVEHEH